MELIGEEEIQEVLEVLRGGYLFRYGISLGAEVDPRFKGKVYQVEREVAANAARSAWFAAGVWTRRFVVASRASGEIRILPLPVVGEIHPGDSLSEKIVAAAKKRRIRLQDRDILVVKHKVVSKAEGALVTLDGIRPSVASQKWARRYGLDARVTELALRESARVVRRKRGVIITETRHGFICANSGVDVSNVDGGRQAALLPKDADRSAARLRILWKIRSPRNYSRASSTARPRS
jgi:hypothetical protein